MLSHLVTVRSCFVEANIRHLRSKNKVIHDKWFAIERR